MTTMNMKRWMIISVRYDISIPGMRMMRTMIGARTRMRMKVMMMVRMRMKRMWIRMITKMRMRMMMRMCKRMMWMLGIEMRRMMDGG